MNANGTGRFWFYRMSLLLNFVANSVEPKPAGAICIQWRPRAHTCEIFSRLKWEIRPRGESGRVYLVAAKIACFGHGRNEKMESEGCGGRAKKVSGPVTLTWCLCGVLTEMDLFLSMGGIVLSM